MGCYFTSCFASYYLFNTLVAWGAFGSFQTLNSRRSRARARRSRARDLDAQTCMHMHTHSQTRTDKRTQAHTFTHTHIHIQAGVGEPGIAYCDIDMNLNTLHSFLFFSNYTRFPFLANSGFKNKRIRRGIYQILENKVTDFWHHFQKVNTLAALWAWSCPKVL